MPPDQRSPPRGDEPTEPRTPANLEARQILEHVEADLFGAAGPSSGRYEIVRKLGAGGMGVVYEAHDPLLDCRVALKQLHPKLAAGPGFLDRLRREARAMARLRTEPNVATLYDFFVRDDVVFVVMEFIEGTTLRAWQHEPRTWAELLAKYLQAGLGLAAAHRAGLVHRDFKPENVMVSPNGRVRVMDFGLVRVDGRGPEASTTLSEIRNGDPLAAERTEGVLGTPRYMSPEQWDGGPVDARSDQFSFCVALWEAVHGVHPFAGDATATLAVAVRAGRLQTPPTGASVPRWLQAVLARGLSADPERRFPTMAGLCAAIERGRARAWVRRGLAGLVLLAAGAVGGLAWQQHAQMQRRLACAADGAEIVGVWNDDARETLRAALVGTKISYAAPTYARMAPWIDRWTGQWSEIRESQCLAAEVEGSLAPESYARAVACLDERRGELAALLDVFGEGDPSTVTRAVPAAASLPELAPCSDPVALGRRPVRPEDPETRDRVDALRRDLARITALDRAGRFSEGLQRAEAALATAEVIGHPPAILAARLSLGILANRAGKADLSEAALTRTFDDAAALGEDEIAARAATSLVFVAGVGRGRPAEGLAWSHVAGVFVDRLGLAERPLGATLQAYLAGARRAAGAPDAAREALQRALALQRRLVGDDHPEVAAALNNLALLDDDRGAYDEARAGYEQALAIQERTLGPEHPNFARALNNLAGIRRFQGAHDEARAMYERVLAIREANLPPTHPDLAGALSNLALTYDDREDYARSRRLYERALAILIQARGSDHADVAQCRSNLASVLEKLGERAQARELYAQALASWEKTLGPDNVALALALVGLGRIAREAGDGAAAVPLLERAVHLRVANPTPPAYVAEAKFELAKAIGTADGARAEGLAREAAEGFGGAGPGFAEQLGEVDAWRRSFAP